ncbi:hypothetical protein JHK82_044392 [Glycine max]|nr:hypothetical protein JHK82_044392 [Glycine max]
MFLHLPDRKFHDFSEIRREIQRAAIIERENHKNDEVKTQIETCNGVSKALNEQKLFGNVSNSNSLENRPSKLEKALWIKTRRRSLHHSSKVNSAVQFCSVKLGKLKSYLGEKGFSQNSYAWMSGLNIIDLVRWRELGLTQTYRKLIKEFTMQEGSIEGIAWRASLLTFENEIYPLNESWVVSGLGHDYTIDTQPINTASRVFGGIEIAKSRKEVAHPFFNTVDSGTTARATVD